METNDQNRNFTISAKVTATQKAKYIDEAKKLTLSLSEWVSGTLDMSINAYREINELEKIKDLRDSNTVKDKRINILNSRLEITRLNLGSKDDKVNRQDITILKLKNSNQVLKEENDHLMKQMDNLKNKNKTTSTFDFLGLNS